MRGLGRRALLLAVAVLAGGCGFGRRPYTHDPLLRDNFGVWGDHGRAANRDPVARTEPVPPRAPNPATLPTREWEVATAD